MFADALLTGLVS